MTDTKTTSKAIAHSKYKTDTKDNAIVEITGSLAQDHFATYRSAAIKELAKKVKVDGFRPGTAPEKVLLKQVGEMAVLEEMGYRALGELYPQIVIKENIKALGRPSIRITKLAVGNDLEFVIETAVMPEIKIADYKKIAKKITKEKIDTEVTDEEVQEAIDNLRKMKAKARIDHERSEAAEEGEKPELIAFEDIKEEDLPELDDEFAKTLGAFESADDLRTKLSEHLALEKSNKGKEDQQIKIMEEVVTKSEVAVPDLLVQYELQKMTAQLQNDIQQAGMKFDEYLKNIDKTLEDLHKEWDEQARTRAKSQLVINHISVTEKLEPSDEAVAEQTKKLMELYKDKADERNIKAYVSQMLVNQGVLGFLMNGGTKPKQDEAKEEPEQTQE